MRLGVVASTGRQEPGCSHRAGKRHPRGVLCAQAQLLQLGEAPRLHLQSRKQKLVALTRPGASCRRYRAAQRGPAASSKTGPCRGSHGEQSGTHEALVPVSPLAFISSPAFSPHPFPLGHASPKPLPSFEGGGGRGRPSASRG